MCGWMRDQWADGWGPKMGLSPHPSLFLPTMPLFPPPSTTPHSGRSTPSSSPSLRKRLQLLPPGRPPPEPEPGTMVEKGSDSSSEKGGMPGTPSTQSLGGRNFIRNSKVSGSLGGWERGRVGDRLILTALLSLAEDAELVQCKCWSGGLLGE